MKIGIFYGSSTGNTETAAELISENFSEHDCSVQDVSSIEPDDLLGYDFLILGISTWYVGEAQDDWIDLLEDMDGMDFNGVKFAIFGQGDQLGYPDTFQDGMGMVYEKMIAGGGEALGFTSTDETPSQPPPATQGDDCGSPAGNTRRRGGIGSQDYG